MIEALKHARNRGQILVLLKGEHPDSIDFIVLRRAMANLALPLLERELASYLYYLEEAGYIVLTRDDDHYILCARIANKGLNLIDRLVKDPAVTVE